MRDVREKILVLSPALVGGGWVSIDEPIRNVSNKFRFIVAGLGPVGKRTNTYTLYHLPYFDYTGACLLLYINSFLNYLYELPLTLMGLLLIILYKPKIVVGNGLCSALSVAPLAKLMNKKVVVSYHGISDTSTNETTKALLRNVVARLVDRVFVNSEGGKKDIQPLIDSKKIEIVKHWADNCFFEIENETREALRLEKGLQTKFVLLYVGAIDRDKMVNVLLDVIDRLSRCDDFRDFYIIFVGTGELSGRVRNLEEKYGNVKYFSYVGDRATLSKLYAVADVVWAIGDTTYLTRPGVEALAAGVPIIVPNIPGSLLKFNRNIVIAPDLIPEEVGWIVDTTDIGSISNLIIQIKRARTVNNSMRDKCQDYARKEYSRKNMGIFTRYLEHASK
jgi:glycosyltransferase involved in cell wall biosynthesis